MFKFNPLKNISFRERRKFLTKIGCKHVRTNGRHEVWTHSDLLRPIVIQTHIDPVPERIMKQILAALEMNKDGFLEVLGTKGRCFSATLSLIYREVHLLDKYYSRN